MKVPGPGVIVVLAAAGSSGAPGAPARGAGLRPASLQPRPKHVSALQPF